MKRQMKIGLIFFGFLQAVYSACTGVYNQPIYCFEGKQSLNLHLECDPDHRIIIDDASYFIAKDTQCPNGPSSDSCKAEAPKDRFTNTCQNKQSCDIEVVKKDENTAKQIYPSCTGGHYFEVKYKCEPDKQASNRATSLSICEKKVWTGTLADIRSYENENEISYIKNTTCACRIYLEKDVQVEFLRTFFRTEPTGSSGSCHQKVVLWTMHGDRVSICQSGFDSSTSLRYNHRLGCYSQYHHINLQFENQDQNYGTAFLIQANVAQGKNLTIECGMNASNMNWTTTTRRSTTVRWRTTPTVGPSSTAEAVGESSPKTGTMAGIGVVVAIVAILVVAGIIFFLKRKKAKEVEEANKNALPPNTFYATISKGTKGSTFTVGDKSTWPRIHAMPDKQDPGENLNY